MLHGSYDVDHRSSKARISGERVCTHRHTVIIRIDLDKYNDAVYSISFNVQLRLQQFLRLQIG
jgi:hypothetical protein